MDLIIDGYGVRSGYNRRKRPPVNRASQVTLRDLEPVATGTDGGSCNSQFSFTERQRELQSAAAFLKTCLKHRSVKTEGIFMNLLLFISNLIHCFFVYVQYLLSSFLYMFQASQAHHQEV